MNEDTSNREKYKKELKENIRAFNSGLFLKFEYDLPDFWMKWEDIINNSEYLPPLYLKDFMEYQLSYLNSDPDKNYANFSYIVIIDNQPVAAVPLLICTKSMRADYYDGLYAPITKKNLPDKISKKVIRNFAGFLRSHQKNTGHSISLNQGFDGKLQVSEWVFDNKKNGAIHNTLIDGYMKISREGLDRTKIRKSYKSLINKGYRLWSVKILNKGDLNIWEEYRRLHITIAGRETRSKESWNKQYDAIVNQNAFLVYLRNESGAMVGGGYFLYTSDEAIYATAAYDRNLFDLPLGHVVQAEAIEELSRLNVKWYKLGRIATEFDIVKPSGKELDISQFKLGFSSHLFAFEKLTYSKGP